MTAHELRRAFINFFVKRGHKEIPSASLVPEHDPTVLFTTAGMHPLIPYLLGEPHPQGTRLVNVQRCLRTDDIDEVGDATHNTFFEMLGNWSFGDYWKEEAISWSFELLLKELNIPLERLAVTIFTGDKDAPRDDESIKIWKKLGISDDRIFPRPRKDNWWGPVGETGPCGPDTEMFIWVGKGKPHGVPNEEPLWVEVWNDVFMQYNKTKKGVYEPLKQKNVDTGMGLERILMVLNEKDSVYETDVFEEMCSAIEKKMATSEIRFTRVIADHIRAATFLIADGVKPSNVERGYIVRRLIRRAIRSAHRSGIPWGFTPDIAKVVIKTYSSVYHLLSQKEQEIYNTLHEEEERFQQPIDWLEQYRQDLEVAVNQNIVKKIGEIPIIEKHGLASGRYVFENFQTYGVPPDLSEDILHELGLEYDKDGFQKAMEEHQEKSRTSAVGRFSGGLADHSEATIRGHTATHLLHQALRDVLGNQVHQTGSNITPERVRFDFSFDRKMTDEEIKQVEEIVNQKIKKDLPVHFEIMSIGQAKKVGALGLFDEKYQDKVKVYFIGDYSKEFCGGPHVSKTSEVGRVRIVKEESAGSGVRRIYIKLH